MVRVGMKATTLAAASLFVGTFTLTAAQAADLGGNCCSDLEERVAELEVTTVRKGNRKVSLQLSGQVNTALLIWDNGDETDVFVVDNDTSSTRFRLKGNAKIKPGWLAGFKIELDIDGHANSSEVSENDDDAPNPVDGDIFELRHADIWIKGPYGKISLGQGDTASNRTSEVDFSGTAVAGNVGVQDIGGGFHFVDSTGAVTTLNLSDTYSQLDGLSRDNRVRYDSPAIAGFILSASWGEDDQWDVALRYKSRVSNFKVAAAIAYSEQENDEISSSFTSATSIDEVQTVNGSISIFHTPSGLNLTFAAGDQELDGIAHADRTFYYGKLGLKRRVNSLGTTAISVDYGFGKGFADDIVTASVSGSELEHIGIQVVQNIDAAAMELYFAWSHNELETNAQQYEDLDFFLLGSRIKF